MTAKKRSGCMGGSVGSAPKNALTRRVDGMTQAGPIKNTVTKPKAVGYQKIKGAVSG